jgi:1-acyl-sn-glycerol-3-phosphate acyltransferase
MSESRQPIPWHRFVTVPGYLLAWLLWLAAAPVWLVVSVAVDIARRNGAVALRSATFLTVYLSCEVMGIAASGGLWLWRSIFRTSAERWTDLHFQLEAWWGTTLFRAVVLIFGVRLEIEDDADLGCGPYLLLPRHASTADTLLASALVTRPYGVRLRYVLKREHRWDPCLDIVGNRLPNTFVDRFSEDSTREVLRVRELARDLGPRDGVLIYPEGTRYSKAKRQRVLDRLEREGDAKMLEYARSLACVLPPRVGGTLGLLEAAPEADVVICSHTGFEGTASLADIWKGALVNQLIRIQFRRIRRSEIPTDRAGQIAWILEEWQRVGAWVETRQSPGSSHEKPVKGSSS